MYSRRQFLGYGSAAFIAASGRVFGVEAPSNRVRLAIVGCHELGRGQRVMKAALRVPGVDIACVCDVDSRAMDWAASQVLEISGVSPKKERDYRKVLEDPSIDGVILETPDHWHAWGAVMAMRAGKAVYVEKPCAFCPREGEVILETQRKTGMVLQVGSQRRSSKTYRDAIKLLHSGAIGEPRWTKCWYMSRRESIGSGREAPVPDGLDWDLWQGPAPRTAFRDNVVHYNWHWFRRWGTAETGNNAPHFADVARWALGGKFPERVTTAGGLVFPKDDDYEWPDTYSMSFEYPGGKFATFELVSHLRARTFKNAGSGAIVYGDRGSVYFGPYDDVSVLDDKGAEIKRWDKDTAAKTGSLTDPTTSLDILHMSDFVACIRSGSQKTAAPADEGYMSSYMPIAANISLDLHESIRTDPETGRPVGNKAAEALWRREYEKGWNAFEA